ncbi:uncharacterized protein BN769_02292 [Prevotella sp. CAG:732]|nr:uncharacterized protein BN769_02292 [Prevotella sp. CAG:732]
MDVESLGYRTETMGGIEVATILLIIFQSPTELVRIGAIWILPIVIPEIIEIVDVSTLGTKNLTEHAMLSHVHSTHLKPVVAAVFENHTVELLLLSQIDEVPALLQVHSRRHLISHVFAILQGTLCHDGMVLPVGGDIHEVDVRTLAQRLVALLAIIYGGRSQSVLAQALVLLHCTLLLIVAESHHLYARDETEVLHGTRSTHSETHESDAHHLLLWQCQAEHILLALRSLRSLNDDFALVPVPLGGRRERLCVCRLEAQGEHSGKGETEKL